jgi:hypothetical protein
MPRRVAAKASPLEFVEEFADAPVTCRDRLEGPADVHCSFLVEDDILNLTASDSGKRVEVPQWSNAVLPSPLGILCDPPLRFASLERLRE